jgi:hypothetical protein
MIRAVLLLLGAIGVPLTLLWDFAWESTIGVDRFFGPPHAANYLAVALAGGAALRMVWAATHGGVAGVALGRMRGPFGAWVTLWGALAFVAALLFDRWWQSSYGLAAGLWHPPQIAKALSYFAVVAGAWIVWLGRQDGPRGALAAAVAAGALLAMISVVTTAQSFANRQHSAVFYEIGCATFPLVLVAHATAGRMRAPASAAALAYIAIVAVMVWILPLVPASPQAGPVYNARDHLLPPPFPLLLAIPALGLDALLRIFPGRAGRNPSWAVALEAGLAFFALFAVTQWIFAGFLLSPSADDWFFAGGGREWPFFLRIDPSARTAFWTAVSPDLDWASAGVAAFLAVASARAGLGLGEWLRGVRR